MLNTEHFHLLAGNPEKWDNETKQRVAAGESLPDVQIDQHYRGRRSAMLVSGINYFYVRAGSNLQEPQVLASPKLGTIDGTLYQALAWGVSWANEDPENREFFANKSTVTIEKVD